jgi:hypothetical protein
MAPMVSPPAPRPPGFSRRTLLAGAAGLALLAAGCTGDGGSGADQPVPPEQADRLAAQVAVQESVVAAYVAALSADPALGNRVATQAEQARQQLERLRAAAPGTASSSPGDAGGPPAGGEVGGWLRQQVGAAAAAHEAACADQVGARAALLGSVAAGLRGQEAVLA